jgi:hypothetical protein
VAGRTATVDAARAREDPRRAAKETRTRNSSPGLARSWQEMTRRHWWMPDAFELRRHQPIWPPKAPCHQGLLFERKAFVTGRRTGKPDPISTWQKLNG